MVAYVTRERRGRREVLVFEHRDHPEARTQVPAGGIHPAETPEQAVLREVREETGLERVRVARMFARRPERWQGQAELNHLFELTLTAECPDAWEHVVASSGGDDGLVFCCRWAPLDSELDLWPNQARGLEELRCGRSD